MRFPWPWPRTSSTTKPFTTGTVLLNFLIEVIPRVPSLEKVQVENWAAGCTASSPAFGFMEDPKLDSVLALARGQGMDLDPAETSFYIGREALDTSGSLPR